MDLTSLAITVGFKFHSRNMTAMGVQVHGTLLNKTVLDEKTKWREDVPVLPGRRENLLGVNYVPNLER